MLIKFPSIGGLHYVRADMLRYKFVEPGNTVHYRGKIKLHGENKAVCVFPDGTVTAQGREALVDESDLSGFGAWAIANADLFRPLASERPIAIFGEWCGDRIKKKAAISQIPERIFAVFAIQIGLFDEETVGRNAKMVVEPDAINAMLQPLNLPSNVYVLPWAKAYEPSIDFSDEASMALEAEKMNEDIVKIDNEDPWVKETFGVSGTGEGLVFYPVSGAPYLDTRWALSTLGFKAKGKSHEVKMSSAPVEIDVQKVESIAAFVETFVTEGRLEQALADGAQGELSTASIGPFLAWLGRDIEKEAYRELEESGLTWKDVSKHCVTKAREWYFDEMKKKEAIHPKM